MMWNEDFPGQKTKQPAIQQRCSKQKKKPQQTLTGGETGIEKKIVSLFKIWMKIVHFDFLFSSL